MDSFGNIKMWHSISIFLIWIMYSCLEGWREGVFFHKVEVDKLGGKILHSTWTIQRALVLGMILATNLDWWVVALPLVFPFFHDGQYYTTRNRFNRQIYTKKWWAQSTTSTAFLTKFETPIVRSILAIIGLLTLILWTLSL